MDIIGIVMMILTQILPLIINKGSVEATRLALQRRQVWYQRIAEAALAAGDTEGALALGEVSNLCGCLSVAESPAAQQQLLGAASDGFAAMMAQMGATATATE